MTLAERTGLTDRRWYIPTAFVVGSFALGVQLALAYQALTGASYPPAGKGLLAWSSLGLLGALAVLHAPTDPARFRALWERVTDKLPLTRQVLVLRPVDEGVRTNGHPEAAGEPAVQEVARRLKVRVHSPLMLGPVVAPGETMPLTVRAEPQELAQDVEVTFTIKEGAKTRETTTTMTGTELVHTETFHEPGPYELEVRVTHPEAEPAVKRIRGRVATYREEVGRLFDALRERAMEAGLEVGPQSTPREVCKGLPALGNASYEDAEALRTHLEIALYGDGEVDRETYEAIHTLLREVGLAPGEEVHA